ncbi:MAG: hypothetical protein ABW033_10050 [Acidimicrobiia bacterium]
MQRTEHRRSIDAAIDDFASRHHGVFPRSEALRLGASIRQIESRLASGRWIGIHEEVYAVAGAPPTPRRSLIAACFAVGRDAFVSHGSAARMWGLPGSDERVVEVTTRRWHRTRETSFVVHESKRTDEADVRIVDSIRVASAELTVMQLGAIRNPLVVEMALDRALYLNLVTLASVRELVDRLGARGRNGVGVLRAILDDRSPGDRAPESPKETQLLRLLLANGLPRPVAQYEVRHHGRFVARVDFAYPDERIAIEYDSYEYHTGTVARDRDAVRRRALLGVDWRVVPVTNADLRSGCVSVATTIATELRRR